MKTNSIIITIVVAIIFAGGGFFGGMKYQQSKVPSFANGQFAGRLGNGTRTGNGQFPGGTNGNRQGFRPVSGQIIDIGNNTFTVKLSDGSSKIVILSDKTEINKADTAGKDELKTGVNVAVFGATNSDGSVTATNIQLNPSQFMGPTPTPVK